MKHIKFGWKPDSVDTRDRVINFKTVDLNSLPRKVDLREHCSTVENQTTLGSCTANAAAGALEYLEIKDGVASDKFENFSRLFIYYNGRELTNNTDVDSGLSVRDALYGLEKKGVCDEVLWPYDVSKFKNKPPSACYLDATNHKIKEYLRLETFNDTLACLAAGFPFVFGFKVYDSFMSSEVAKSGAAAMPLLNENSVGWHAVCAVGYDMEAKTVLMRNSWGEGWGRGGYFTLPFDYISNPELAQDFWTIRRVGKEKITFIKKLINFFKTLFKK